MKKVFSLMALLLVAMFVTACGGGEEKRTAPSADVKVISQAYLHGEESSLKKIGMTKEEYDKQFISEFAKSFTSIDGLNFSDEQIQKVGDAFKALLLRATFETADVSTNGDDATVKVTVSTLPPMDENAMFAKLPENIAELSEEEKNTALANAIIGFIQEWQPNGTTEFNVDCKYDANAKMWIPVNVNQFGITLMQKIFGA